MAKLKKKPREIEEEIVTIEEEAPSSLNDFIDKYRNVLLGVGGLLVVGIAAIFYLQYQGQVQNQEANENMFQAVKYFETDSLNKALEGDGAGALGLLDIESDYSGTEAANQAKYYIGIIYLRQGKLEEGLEYLSDFSEPSGTMLAMSSYMAQGFAHEDLGDPAEAASFFSKAASAVGGNEHTTPVMLLNAGRNYEAAGQISKALSAYQTIKEKYPNSTEGRQIDKYIGRVSK